MSDCVYFSKVNEPNGYMSQWATSPFTGSLKVPNTKIPGIEHTQGYNFITAEHYMMYSKAILFADYQVAAEILSTINPHLVKKLGRKVKNFNPDVWDKYKYKIVVNGNYLKFQQNPTLYSELQQTANMDIAEASPWDNIWGIGISPAKAKAGVVWRGSNLLGKAIVEVRDILSSN